MIGKFKLVVLESPYRGNTEAMTQKNREYARACLRDCITRRESPIASHPLLTQMDVLDDKDEDERRLGMEAGHAWIAVADAVVVYQDLGISGGMWLGIKAAEAQRKEIIYRSLYVNNRRDV